MKDRIKQVMEWTGLSQQDFANKLGISPASLSSIFNGRTNPTNNHVQAIHRSFPEIDINWLLFGEGEMFCRTAAASSVGDGTGAVGGNAGVDNVNNTSTSSNPQSGGFQQGSIFPDEAFNVQLDGKPAPAASASAPSYSSPLKEELALLQAKSKLMESMNKIDKAPRKIKEIRVFYDDGTYESFSPSSK